MEVKESAEEKVKFNKPRISVHMLSKEASLDRSLKLLSDLSILPSTKTLFKFENVLEARPSTTSLQI
jgi:hypothetical protein